MLDQNIIEFSFSDSLLKELSYEIEEKLKQVGIMFRIFSRCKDASSLSKKLDTKKTDHDGNISEYGVNGKKIQDAIGIRIALYFNDDIHIVHKIINNIFNEKSQDSGISKISDETFSAIRYNIIYDIPPEKLENEYRYKNNETVKKYIDSTFELQIRSILSEGWHEVEHDLRYKAKDDWINYKQESRKLNGVYATLETAEWTMIKIFDELAYNHYKNQNWESMLRHKFRLRIINDPILENIKKYLNENNEIAKKLYRIQRRKLISKIADENISLPLSLNTIIFLCNSFYVKDHYISTITPKIILEETNMN